MLLLFIQKEKQMIIPAISRQCFVYSHKLDHGNIPLQLSLVMLLLLATRLAP